MPERTLTVRIVGDDRSLQQAFARSQKAGKGFQVGIEGLGAAAARSLIPAAAAAVSVQQAFQLAASSVDEASAINEEVSKSRQIFSTFSDEVVDWSETMATSFGVSQRAALEATGIFGNLFRVVGLGPEASAEMSRALVELAADMASFNNASPEDVLLAIRSGLVGEAEPLRRYGVLLSETRVQQVAMADTGKRTAAALTDQEKAMARYKILLTDTAPAQGDFARTSGSLANQTKELKAQLENLSASVGNLLVPKLTEAVTAANNLFAALELFQSLPDDLGIPELPDWLDVPGIDLKGSAIATATGGLPGIRQVRQVNAIADLLGLGDEAAKKIGAGSPGASGEAIRDFFIREADAAREAAAKAAAAKAATAASAKAWAEFVTGMGLKLDKARLTESTDNDLNVLREFERAILRRIRAEGRTLKLVQLLTNTRLQINAILGGKAADAAAAASDAFSEALDLLDLDLARAEATKGFADNLRALRAIETQILKQIQAEGRTAALMRRLFENRQEQAQTVRDARNAAGFESLGLTAEGEERAPSRGALLRRAQSLQEQIKGTVLDTPATRRKLAQIIATLKDAFKSGGREVRLAALGMLNDISSAFDDEETTGPLTKWAKRGANDLIRGLNLTEAEIKEIRQRFSQFGRLDLAPGGRTVAPARDLPRGAERTDVVVNVYVDGQKVESSVTRRQQKKRGRNAPQRRGVRPGI